MILFLLYVLAAVTVQCQHVHPGGFRRSRQLDLGLQDINNDKEQNSSPLPPLEAVNNGYLPPASPEKVVGAQSQESPDFKSSSTIENDLCRPPFDVLFCGAKASVSKTDDSGIPKPARDLIPPFNDLEQGGESTTKRQQTPKPTEDYSVFSAVSHSTFSSTTRRPVTQTTTTTTQRTVPTTKALPRTSTLNKAEATDEQRSYLPPQPEFSAAAQTSVGVVRPPEPNNDHHHDHHDHHHHHHGNICEDAFHSFLCAPLKARKRITGALPNSLRGQSSFVQYQKTLPNPDREPSSSNTFQNEYLPPKLSPSPSNTFQNEYLPPKPSPSPSPSPSNVFRNEYLPPKLSPSPAPSNTFRNEYLPPKPSPSPSPSNIVQSTYTPPRTTPRRIVTTTTTTTTTTTPKPYFPPILVPQQSNANDGYYLPPLLDNKLPSPSNQFDQTQFISTTQKPITTTFSTPKIAYHTKTVSPVFVSVTTPKPIVSVPVYTASSNFIPAASFQYSSSTPNVILPVFSTFAPLAPSVDRSYLPPQINPQPSASFVSSTRNIIPVSTFKPLPTVTSFAPVSQNVIRLSPVTTTTTKKPFTTTFRTIKPSESTTPRPTTFVPQPSNPSGSYLPPQQKIQSPSNVISTTVKPFTTTRRPSTTTPRYIEQPSTQDRSYLPPEPNVQPAAAQISSAAVAVPQVKNPFHHGRDLCTDPFHSFLCSVPKSRKRITGALPNGFRPDSSNTNELRVKPAPSFQNENRIRPEKPLETSQTQNLGYSYPKPVNPFPSQSITVVSSTPAPTTGYSYPKPDKVFPLPSQQKEVKIVTTKRPQPTTFQTSEARVVTGYDYPKPEQKFPLPAQQIISTVKPPTTGYSYPKPEKVFPLPSQQQEVKIVTTKRPQPTTFQTSEARVVTGYEYPKPEQKFPLPAQQIISTVKPPTTGYSYPKPQKPFPLPSEQKEVKLVTTKRPQSTTFQTSEARVVTGYEYPKPEQKFPLPAQQIISTVKPPTTGYSYPKPQKPFPLPTEQKEVKLVSPKAPAPVVSQATNQAVGYSYPKPEQSFNLPERKGYSYPKPEKRLELPTESESKTLLPQSNPKIDLLKDLGSAEFIPVNKLDKREQPSTLLSGLRKFGERLRKREKLISN